MNRNFKESVIGRRNIASQRRGPSLTGISNDTDENLVLFSTNRRSPSVPTSDESGVSVKLGKLSVGSAKLARSGADDLLLNNDGGKHDYDWLLTPPETPLFPSSGGNEPQPASMAPRTSSFVKSIPTAKASWLSVCQPESNRMSRPSRSSSATRPAISTSQYSNKSFSSSPSSILNTSSASVSSYIRSSTPTRSSSSSSSSTPTSMARPSTPSRTRSSTPSRVRPPPSTSCTDRSRPSLNSRPSTPSSRPQNTNSTATRTLSRPSTPTRRNPAPSLSPVSNGRNMARSNSPSPRIRPPPPQTQTQPQPQPKPIVLSDFPLDTPPNLRTTLPDRPLSTGRSRPGSVKGNVEMKSSANMTRRQPSPVVSRGRLSEPSGRGGRVHASAQARNVSELSMQKTSSADGTGFGRTISKRSMDMAIRHMDIRNGTGGIRPLNGTTLFPQSIRSTNPKSSRDPASDSSSDAISDNGNQVGGSPEKGTSQISGKVSELDMYESSRYDAILLKEDLSSMNWLHGLDDKPDQGLIFDNGFEPLPEPFAPL